MSEVLLSAKNLSVRFGGVLAVNQVSFDVRRGEVFTLIGPNGAGKTTVFNLISRIYTPTTGEIEFEGQRLLEQPPHKIASLGIYGRWLKVRTWFQIFPFYRRGLFRRQKAFQKSDRLK